MSWAPPQNSRPRRLEQTDAGGGGEGKGMGKSVGPLGCTSLLKPCEQYRSIKGSKVGNDMIRFAFLRDLAGS